jgi:hypothetical protein
LRYAELRDVTGRRLVAEAAGGLWSKSADGVSAWPGDLWSKSADGVAAWPGDLWSKSADGVAAWPRDLWSKSADGVSAWPGDLWSKSADGVAVWPRDLWSKSADGAALETVGNVALRPASLDGACCSVKPDEAGGFTASLYRSCQTQAINSEDGKNC